MKYYAPYSTSATDKALKTLPIPHKLLKEITSHYFEKHRFYHGWNHINHLYDHWYFIRNNLNVMENGAINSDESLAIDFAILFHDVIYSVGSKSNEDESVLFFLNAIEKYKLEINQFVIDLVVTMILRTKDHFAPYEPIVYKRDGTDEPYSGIAVEVFRDLDLRAMSQSWPDFQITNELIRLEFETKFTPEEVNKGRIEFLTKVSNSKIYTSNIFWHRLEDVAHKNIERLLNELSMR